MFRHAFKPGSSVAQTGTYWVHHYQHRISHLSYFNAGERFPECLKCGMRVRFELAPEQQQAEHISLDADFRSEEEAATG
jgi:hypothetical protein